MEIGAAGGLLTSIRALLELAADPNMANRAGDTPLMMAVVAGHEEAVEMLIAAGAMVRAINAQGESAASIAKQLGLVKTTST